MRSFLALLPALAVGCGFAAQIPQAVKTLKGTVEAEQGEVPDNLKQIIQAIHKHQDSKNWFPYDSADPKSGKLLLSWRVHLLPYLGEVGLYQSFNLNEPWDSPTNSQLVNRMPSVFAASGSKAKAGETYYRGFAGEGAAAGIFETGKKASIVTISDGTSGTIAVIDAGDPVPWTKPGTDLPISPKAPLPKLGGMSDGDFFCVLCDGTVKKIRRDFDEKEMRAAISRNGGEILNEEKLFVNK